MADFTKRSDFNPKANFTSVLFGANSPLLEVELNELQQIAEEKRMEIIRLLTQADPSKTVHVSKEQVDAFTTNLTSTITLSKFNILFKNQVINVPAGSYSVPFLVSLVNNNSGSSGILYFAYKEEVANPSTTLEEDAIRGGASVSNKILDTRFGSETTRRTLLKFGGIGSDTALASAVSDGYTLQPIFTIRKVNNTLQYTAHNDVGYFTLGNYSIVKTSGSLYPALSNLNAEVIPTGFYVATSSTSNKPTTDSGIAMVLNEVETSVRMIIFFTQTGRLFMKNAVLSPFSTGAWTEISPSDLSGAVLSTLLTGLSTASSADVTSSDSILTAFGKLQKKASDIVTSLSGHTSSTSNPHSVTKSQVGLGSVLNYGLATQAEAEAGTSDVKYMTPLKTKQAILYMMPTDTADLTKSDVYTKTEVNSISSGKANAVHTHAISDVSGLQASLNSKLANSGFTASRVMETNASGAPVVSSITTAKLGYLTDVTSNIQAQINSKQATLTGAVTTIASSNLTLNRVLVSDASGKVAVSTIGVDKLGYLNDVTSAIQSQLNGKASSSHAHPMADVTGLQTALDAKQATITGGASSVVSANLTANRALTSDASGKISQSAVTATELGYLSGVTSAIQTQLNAKSASTHNHTLDSLSNTTITSNSAGEILKWSGSAWINNTLAEAGIAPATHAHTIANVTGLQTALDAKAPLITGGASSIATSNLTASRALVADASGKVDVSAVTSSELAYLSGVTSSLQTQLNGKASSSHAHSIADVTGLQTQLNTLNSHNHTLDSLSNTNITYNTSGEILKWDGTNWINNTLAEAGIATATHTHTIDKVVGLQSYLDSKADLITGGATTIATANLTTNRALISSASGKVAVSAVTATELGYLDGVTSSIQTQLNGKASSTHSHSYLPLTGGTTTGLLTASGGLKIGAYRLTISASAPSSPATGDIWIDI